MSVYSQGDLPNGQAVPGGRHSVPRSPAEPSGGDRPQRWPLVADDLFRVLHDDRGVPVLRDDAVGMGLAAALLAELLLTGRVTVHAGRVSVLTTASPVDALANKVLAEVRDEQVERSVRDWIHYLADESVDRVARRMAQAGHLEAHTHRRLRTLGLSTATRYVPTEMNDVAWAWARLARLIERRQGFDPFDTALAGLIKALELHRKVLVIPGIDVEYELRGRVQLARPEMRELLSITEAVVGDRVIAS
jgi:hypothetical protein